MCSKSTDNKTPYNAIVSKDGIENFNTTDRAILVAPNHSVKPFFIKIKKGTYQEYIRVNKKKTNIFLIGEGMDTTIIKGSRSFVDDYKIYDTATIVEADLTAFYICQRNGYQDTLYVKRQHQFYREYEIYETIVFICGGTATLLKNCLIERDFEDIPTEIVLQNCTIKAIGDNVTMYLGRPWGIFSRTVIMKSYIGNLIDPRGWAKWIESTNKFVSRRPYYLEY
ncbi:hypothetical protein R3W88_019290 [Solanum pinnatisectum]|uniref:Pectinesterase catalytic domain-containing protein n=1 Tax=Solanum pinnatisectum TaxID=50273 RepID=A0AAV9KKG4_9SOLN|nr:hypothetical protein R3W88_019290 [Solanum pinnatisectum]